MEEQQIKAFCDMHWLNSNESTSKMLKDLYAGDRIIRFLFTVIRNLFKKLKPSITNGKYYEHFSNEAYR